MSWVADVGGERHAGHAIWLLAFSTVFVGAHVSLAWGHSVVVPLARKGCLLPVSREECEESNGQNRKIIKVSRKLINKARPVELDGPSPWFTSDGPKIGRVRQSVAILCDLESLSEDSMLSATRLRLRQIEG